VVANLKDPVKIGQQLQDNGASRELAVEIITDAHMEAQKRRGKKS
jgi:hypothetical protein